jgi:hypothetical protein
MAVIIDCCSGVTAVKVSSGEDLSSTFAASAFK